MKKRTKTEAAFSHEAHYMGLHEIIADMHRINLSGARGYKRVYDRAVSGELEEDFYGTKGFDDFFAKISEYTVPAATGAIFSATHQNDVVAELVPSLTGIFFDPAAFNEGRPDCMADYEHTAVSKFKDIIIDTGVGSKVDISTIQKYASESLRALIDLESSGTRCRVIIGCLSIDKATGDTVKIFVLIKDHNEPLNGAFHGFLLGHPAFFRTVIISYLSLFIKSSGCGTPKPIPGAISYKDLAPSQIYDKIINS